MKYIPKRPFLMPIIIGTLVLSGVVIAEQPTAAGAATQTTPTVEQQRKSAWAAMQAKNWKLAIERWTEVLSVKPDDNQALQERSSSYAETGQHDLALRDGQHAVQLEPKNAYAWNSLCWGRILANAPLEARPACEKAFDLLPTEMAPSVNLGHTYLLTGDRKSAWSWYEKTIPLLEAESDLYAGPIGDFDIFILKGWRIDLVKEARLWFEARGNEWLKKKAATDSLLKQATAAEEAKDFVTAAALRERHLPLLIETYGIQSPRLERARVALFATKEQLADQLVKKGRYAEAIALLTQQLTSKENHYGHNSIEVIPTLDRLSNALYQLGSYSEAERCSRRSLAIIEKIRGPRSVEAALALKSLSVLLRQAGKLSEARSSLQRALSIVESIPNHDEWQVQDFLTVLAGVLRDDGHYEEADLVISRAYAMSKSQSGRWEANGDFQQLIAALREQEKYKEADALQSMIPLLTAEANKKSQEFAIRTGSEFSLLLETTGRYAEAERILNDTIDKAEQFYGQSSQFVATLFGNMGHLQYLTGRYSASEAMYLRSLTIDEETFEPDHPQIAVTLNNLAGLYQSTGQQTKAEHLLVRALSINERAFGSEHWRTANSLSNLAVLYETMGQYAKAEPLYNRALAIKEHVLGPAHPSTGATVSNLAGLQSAMGQYVKAESLYLRAYRIALNAGEPRLAWNVQGNLSTFYKSSAPDLAIFYGKQAVNTLQAVRGQLKDSDKDTQKSFLSTVEKTYQNLAGLLISQGRLPEAQQVLKMLKEDEYRDFIRRSQDAQIHSGLIAYTGAEQPWAEEGDAIAQEGKRLALAIKPLGQGKSRGLSAEDEKQLSELLAAKKTLGDRFDRWFADIAKELPIDSEKLAEKSRQAQEAGMVDARAKVARQGQHAALVEYLMVGDRLHILLTTPKRSLARQVDIDSKAIYRKLVDFRQVLESPGSGGSGSDPRILGKELYDTLFAPVAGDLQADGTQTLMLSLEGALRYVPFAALYDGEHYLIERYALSMHTAAGKRNDVTAEGPLRVAALGTTAAHEGFKALPGVKREMDILFKEGGLTGDVYLDRRFTAEQLHLSLNKRYPVLHVASHFKFTPGNEADSFLLLGDGKHLSLMELREGNYPFQGLDLLTLSACETAMQGGREANGREVEGFGALAQNKGAGAVLATLWSIADASTPDLMKAFYQQRVKGRDKPEALRQAQLALLLGQAARSSNSSSRGERKVIQATNAFSPDPKAPYAHPYYWAPFILMGNWL